MTEKQFCSIYTAYNGEVIDKIGQLVQTTMYGEELKELIEFFIDKLNQNKMTAVEFLLQNDDKDFRLSESGLNVSDVMIEFAKLHVEAALKAASYVDQDSILNSYPLENIK